MSRYLRIRDLPEAEQEPFSEWLRGQTVPVDPTLPDTPEEQDCYYTHDYTRWKTKLKTGWELFD